jgi:hypothetical protein
MMIFAAVIAVAVICAGICIAFALYKRGGKTDKVENRREGAAFNNPM